MPRKSAFTGESSPRARPFPAGNTELSCLANKAHPAQNPASFPGLAFAHHCLVCRASITPFCFRFPHKQRVSEPLLGGTLYQKCPPVITMGEGHYLRREMCKWTLSAPSSSSLSLFSPHHHLLDADAR